jgi:hypothetical protein
LATILDVCSVCLGTGSDLDCNSRCFGGTILQNSTCGFCP